MTWPPFLASDKQFLVDDRVLSAPFVATLRVGLQRWQTWSQRNCSKENLGKMKFVAPTLLQHQQLYNIGFNSQIVNQERVLGIAFKQSSTPPSIVQQERAERALRAAHRLCRLPVARACWMRLFRSRILSRAPWGAWFEPLNPDVIKSFHKCLFVCHFLEGVHAMYNREGFASNGHPRVLLRILVNGIWVLRVWGCKASRFMKGIWSWILPLNCCMKFPSISQLFVRQFAVSFARCLCDLAPALAGAVFFRNPTLPPLWGDGFRCDLGIGWDSLCRCYMCRIAFMIIPHRRALEKQGSCPVFML